MVTRREQASLSEEVDATRRAHFQVIESLKTSPKPAFPNRVALVPIALIVSLFAGIAASFFVAKVFFLVTMVAYLRAMTQRQVFGSVCTVRIDVSLARVRHELIVFISVVGPLILIY